jgi:hypothetical protein
MYMYRPKLLRVYSNHPSISLVSSLTIIIIIIIIITAIHPGGRGLVRREFPCEPWKGSNADFG